MPGPSPFGDYWRAALREQYKFVVSRGDKRTEATLRALLLGQLGFTESEVQDLYIRATMHVDQVGADFVPDAEFVRQVEAEAAAVVASEPPPVSAEVVAAVAAQMDAALDAQADTSPPADDPPDPPPDVPAQLSLF